MQIGPARYQVLPPVIKNLIIINILFFFATFTVQNTFGIDLSDYLALFFPYSDQFYPYQFVTSMFMHGSFSHIFFNLFTLWMFGSPMENRWGSKKFLIYYMVTGIGAGILYEVVNVIEYYQYMEQAVSQADINYLDSIFNQMRVVGASGAVYGVLLAMGLTYPNNTVYLYFAIPVKIKYFVLVLGLLEFYNGFSNPGSQVAHFAHLGGMLFGFLLIRYWNKRRY